MIEPISKTLTFREEGDVVVVDVCGKLTIGRDSAGLRAMLQELAEAGYRHVLLNMAGVTDIDSSGLGDLMASWMNLVRLNGALKLLNLQERVSDVFHTTRLDSVFQKYEDEGTAILSFYIVTQPSDVERTEAGSEFRWVDGWPRLAGRPG